MRQHILSKTGQRFGNPYSSLSAVVHASASSEAAIIICLLALSAVTPRALADVRLEGSVLLDNGDGIFYSENPFTTANDGIPLGGNIIEGFRTLPGDPLGTGGQVRFEGRAVDNFDDPANPTPGNFTDDANQNFHIVVGRTSSGQMSILGGSDLRDMDLIIGDSAEIDGQFVRGTGTVRIDGEGSLYNNNPFLIPFAGLPPPYDYDPDNPIISVNPRQLDVGFDMYVGRAGTGVLEISLGGRAEIQDAVIVGDQPNSSGTIIVDGFGSFLGSGGFESDDIIDPDERHEMIIGRFGNGEMRITNGGTVYTVKPDVANLAMRVAAVIGSNLPFVADSSPPDGRPGLAGSGTVTVEGIASRWVLGGTLEIGGYHDARPGDMEDMEGDDAFYPAFTGRGTLNVGNGGLVNIVPPSPDLDDPQPVELDVVIGRFGTLNLDGGSVDISPVVDVNAGIGVPRDGFKFRIINDGLIGGSGNILVGQFRNRALGEVRVGPGQKLVVNATGQFDAASMDDEPPLQNFGLIEALGNAESRAELEFVRTPSDFSGDGEPVTPFLNQRHGTMTGNGGRSQGDIVAQHAILRFGSGIENHGNMTFTAGDNVVSGDVVNEFDGAILVSGNTTTVTFEDMFMNSGSLQIAPNVSLITALEDFTMGGSGSLSISVGGRPESQSVSHLSVVGDLLLDGLLEVSLFASSTPFSPQPGDTFEIMRAGGELIGDFAAFNLPFVNPTVGLFAFPDFTLDAYFITTLDSTLGVGADFNGDGVVDDVDLAIWRQNLGNPGGLGDANGDGIVNGVDFFIWQMAVAVPGAGSGLTGAVPEPTSCLLLAFGSLLALAHRRRK